MSKLITVFGATGNQGGSVINCILADPELSKTFKIRGITRDVSKPAAKALEKRGVEVTTADMDSLSSVSRALTGSHTVFLVTNYWEKASGEIELQQGKNVTDAAREASVKHLIFSSLLHVTETTEGRLSHVPHFDGKAEIEKYIKASGLGCTFVLPGYFMSNLTSMMQKGSDDSYTLSYPISAEAQFPLFDAADDMGKFVVAAMKNAEALNGERIYAATDYYSVKRMLAEFEEVTGKKAQFKQVSAETYKSYLPPAIAEEMLENHLFIEDPGYYNGASLGESLSLLSEKPTSWKDFVAKCSQFK